LNKITRQKTKTKLSFIKEGSKYYFKYKKRAFSPYQTGKDFFSLEGSGNGTLSQTYKSKLKTKICTKNT